MAVEKIKKEYTEGFVMIDLKTIMDTRLSNKDLGVLVRLLSLEENWKFSSSGLASIYQESSGTFMASLKRLSDLGYVKFKKQTRYQGRFGDGNIIIIEQPEGRISPKGKLKSKSHYNKSGDVGGKES